MKTLENLRKEIDKLDKEISRLLDERFKLCEEIGKLKAGFSAPVLDGGREQAIYEGIRKSGLAYCDHIAGVYSRIMEESRALQKRITDGKDN